MTAGHVAVHHLIVGLIMLLLLLLLLLLTCTRRHVIGRRCLVPHVVGAEVGRYYTIRFWSLAGEKKKG